MRSYLLLLVLAALPTQLTFAQDFSPERPAFSAPPEALRKAFSGVTAETNDVTVLLDEERFEFDDTSRFTYRHRLIFKVWTKAGAESWAMVQHNWAPWLGERPVVRARVIAPDGTISELDPKTIADAPVRDGDDEVLTDRRTIRAPLPAMELGSVVEQEIIEKQTKSSFQAGMVHYFDLGFSVPVERSRLQVRVPETVAFRYETLLLPGIAVTDKKQGGFREIVFDQGPMKALERAPSLLPPDEPRTPQIVFSTAQDWNSIAKEFATLVETQLQGFDGSRYLPKFGPNATREAKILAIVDKLNREIRYTGIEFSEASVIPRQPGEVLDRKFGDCKDKSALAVALLRAAGIESHVALLYSSMGEDIEPDLPGMGVFNHAIVYVPGQPDLWLDLTDPNLRLNVVSPANQGRWALVARPQTTALIRTPELTADDNRVSEKREFWLAELGRAKVTEDSESFGVPDREYRSLFGDKNEKALRENLKSYVDYTYGESKIERITHSQGPDLTQPFRIKVELKDSQRGTSARSEAAVGIFLSQIAQRLPRYLREAPKEEKDDSKPASPARTQDFFVAEPFTYEWHYAIHAPAGFRIRSLAESKEERFGPATLASCFKAESDTEVIADFRFLMPKRRFSAAEGLALRDGMVELSKRKALLISFDEVGETALASGRVKEALADFQELRKLHPHESLHAMQTARALLAAGVGDAARAEARRAVAMEPGSSKVYVQYAEILTNDLIGRPVQKGFDADGAAEAYRKALELDPKDDETRAQLAILLEYNTAGDRYGAGAKLDQAIAEYKKLGDNLAALNMPQNYPIAMVRAERMAELKEYLNKQPDTEHNRALLVCAEAVLSGSKVAVQRAGEVSSFDAKQRILASAGQTLIAIREYALAADIFEAGAAGTQNPAAVANLVQTLRNTKRSENQPALVVKEPEDVMRVFLARAMKPDLPEKDLTELASPWLLEGQDPGAMKAFRRGLLLGMAKRQDSGLTMEVTLDIAQSVMQFSREGSDETGWVLHISYPGSGPANSQSQALFVIKENGNYRLLGAAGENDGVARLVLKLADEGQIEGAKTWLDRVRQEQAAGGGDDPLSGPLFARFWQSGQAADLRAVRVAAAIQLATSRKSSDNAAGVLGDALQEANETAANVILAALTEAYFNSGQYANSLTMGERLLEAAPQSPTALRLALRAAYAAGGQKEADRIATTNLDRFKNNVVALRGVAVTAMVFGDTTRSNEIEKHLIDSGRAQANDYNQLAWGDLMAGKTTASTLEIANKGMLLGGNESTGMMHTLAAVDAELGKEAEARAVLLQRMKLLGQPEPDDDDWYVLGRIAEQYGLTEEAAGMYRKLEKPTNELMVAASSYALAQRRLRAIETAKQNAPTR